MDNQSFKPAWWLPGPHLQTLWPSLCRQSIKKLNIKRERLELPDGDFVDLDWVGESGQPIVMILHGLEGSIESHYAKGMLNAILCAGWRGVFMHFRGCSGEPNRLSRSYHSGETKDLDYVVKTLKKREPDAPLAAIGFSLGGNVLLKWLGETRNNYALTAAIAVSVPFELDKSVQCLQNGFAQLYQRHLLKCLRIRFNKKYEQQTAPIDLSSLPELQTIHDFDAAITVPLHGFSSLEEYYSTSSSRQYLRHIQVPTLIIHAKDDPFTNSEIIPTDQELSPQVKLEVTESGGHVGFVSGIYPWRAEYWLENRVPIFLKEFLQAGSANASAIPQTEHLAN